MPEYILAELCEPAPRRARGRGRASASTRRQAPEDVLETHRAHAAPRCSKTPAAQADRHDLEAACLAAGMKLSSFNNRIAYSPIIAELGHNRYGLRGLGNGGRSGGSGPRRRTSTSRGPGTSRPSARRAGGRAAVVYRRIAAVAGVLFFAAVLVWLYGVKTTVIWAAAMTAFLLILWAATIPLRRRQRRVWLEMGLGPDGRPRPEEDEEEEEEEETRASVEDASDPRRGEN